MIFIEGLAVVRYDMRDAVEVDFFGEGDIYAYKIAVQAAIDMAKAYAVNKWVFLKTNFKDLDSYKFLSSVIELMKPVPGHNILRKVMIITKIQAYRKMSMLLKYMDLNNKDNRSHDMLDISIEVNDKDLIAPFIVKKIA